MGIRLAALAVLFSIIGCSSPPKKETNCPECKADPRTGVACMKDSACRQCDPRAKSKCGQCALDMPENDLCQKCRNCPKCCQCGLSKCAKCGREGKAVKPGWVCDQCQGKCAGCGKDIRTAPICPKCAKCMDCCKCAK